MLQKVNEQNTEKTTIYTNKEVQDFMMSAGNVDSTSDQNGLVLPKAYTVCFIFSLIIYIYVLLNILWKT